MRVLAIIMFSFLVLATLFAKKSPEKYNLIPFGAEEQKSEKKPFTLSACFSAYPIWGLILTFLFCMMAEFLLWTQLVSYWRFDLNWDTATAIKTYSLIGLAGIITMPLMGLLADKMVKHSKNEIQGRKRMLLIGSILGLTATAIIISVGNSLGLTYLACFIFAIYWAIIPGGVVGYTGSVYGRKNLGKIWGLVTLIVMAIGPFVGTFMGSWLKDTSGFYRYSLFFSLFSFSLAVIFAATLPVKIKNS